jgi:ATP-dependent DNA helicase DinG
MPQPSAKLPSPNKFFGRSGLLSKWHPNFEYRPGQLEMAEAVEAAINDRKHLVVEAGTGTGKTLAYLVPALLSGKRVVVSTGTKNLQEQLFFKDIPFLQQHFETPIRACYMKGRNNYLCRQKVYDAERSPILTGIEEITDFRMIREWEQTTQTGDRAELRTLPENSSLWPKLDARRDLCKGQKCQQFERCFLTLMHQRAAESDLIIVNHHLFFADLALRDEDFGAIIPDYAAVIFDEAHEIEDIAGQYFGLSISNHQLNDLTRDVAALARAHQFGGEDLDEVLSLVSSSSSVFFSQFGEFEGRVGFKDHASFLADNGEAYHLLQRSLEMLRLELQMVKSAPDEVIPLFRRAAEYSEALRLWLEQPTREQVYYVERRGRGVYLQATPIEVSTVLRDRLFESVATVVLTSATLAVADDFDFTKRRLGIPYARTLSVQGTFDYPSQALLYVPQHLPEPRSPAFSAGAANEIIELLNLSNGRAFVLFTSYSQMKTVYDRVSLEIEYPTLLQGTAPRNALLDQFRATPNAVLFATSSFWQGVDVQGDQLSCVIIDKLPFAVPSDPVVQARSESIREAGGNPFYDYQIPQAALALKQGFGRLIRSRSDRGVLCILDHRITSQRYGQIFFDSLPDYGFTTSREEVAGFFGKNG